MGSGCSCPCNSSRNISPSNFEKLRYNKLDDLTKNEIENSPDQHESSFTDISPHSVPLLDTPNTNANSNESSLHSRCEEITSVSPDFSGESSRQEQDNHFFNTRTEDSRNGMSLNYRGSRCNSTLSCRGFDRTSVNDVVDSQVEMNKNNTFDAEKGMLLELNSNICIVPTLVSAKKIQNLKNSKLTCQRVSYVEPAISKTMSDSSCRKADLEEFHNISCSSSTNRQSGPCNSGKVSQVKSKM